ncbi:MAG: DUF2087 domain-containing protein [Actinomadura sp.]
MSDEGLRRVVGLLAADESLRVFAALVLTRGTLPEIVASTGLPEPAVVQALSRLERGRLASRSEGGWTADRGAMRDALRAAAKSGPAVADPAPSADDPILNSFLRDGRLVSIPARRGKRRVVLDYIARVFEPGVTYTEREVDTALRAFHADYPALRRHLVDEGLLSRDHGRYWRTGGTVEM